MDAVSVLNIKKAVLLLKTLDNGYLAVIDCDTTLRLYSTREYTLVGGFKSNIVHESVVGNFVDIAIQGSFLASMLPSSGKAALFSVAKKELLYKIGRHHGDIESLAIGPQSRYLATGGQDGKTFVWALKTARLAFTLPPHSDYVTAIAFSDSGQFIATGSYDRTLHVQNLATMKTPLKLRGHTAAVMNILFLSRMRLLSTDKEGKIIVWDMVQGHVISRLPKMSDDITALTLSDDKRFLFVGTKLGYVSLYDLDCYEQLKQRYMKLSESITSLEFIKTQHHLAVGTAEGNITIHALFGDQEYLDTLVRNRAYKELYEMVEANPLMAYSQSYESVELIWDKTLTQAKKFMEKGDRKNTQALFAPFAEVPKKKSYISSFLNNFEMFEHFKTHIQNKKYPLAYTMVHQYPEFRESKIFQQLELHWKKLFLEAQKLILQKGGEEKARQLLAPFRGISEKAPFIQQLFSQQKMYLYFKKLVATREFKKTFELLKVHAFLKEFPEYESMMNYADTLYMKAHEKYSNREYHKAQQLCDILCDFPDYTKEAREMMEAIKAYRLFYDAIASHNLHHAFALMSSFPLLYDTAEGAALEQAWGQQVDVALKHASKGDALGVQHALESYMTIDAKKEAIATLFQQCYLKQLENLRKESASLDLMEQGIRNYVNMFGLDDMIEMFYKEWSQKVTPNFDIETFPKGSVSHWSSACVVTHIATP
ncbi:MAG: hypothetical protein DSZ03_08240 [Sulfurimonas sp.]|nr:MAG: hypothetical protein DSZ03_08240 [Sulfurimonas sp.]